MIAKYYGVFCAGKNCGKFIKLGSYRAVDASSIGVDCTPATHRCEICGTVCTYSRADVAHSVNPNGDDPYYPHR